MGAPEQKEKDYLKRGCPKSCQPANRLPLSHAVPVLHGDLRSGKTGFKRGCSRTFSGVSSCAQLNKLKGPQI